MNRQTIITVALLILVLLSIGTQAKSEDYTSGPTISVSKLDISDKTLELSYEIKNKSKKDIWLLAGFGRTSVSAEAFMKKDNQTLLIRRRLDVPFNGGDGIPYFRYVLLRSEQSLTESVKRNLPFHPQYGFGAGFRREAQGLEYATRLAIEIGYYTDDLPERISSVLEKADKIATPKSNDESKIKYYFISSLYYNKMSEILRQRSDEILVPYTYQWFKGEKVLQTTADELRIPYEEKEDDLVRQHSLDVPTCTRIEIQFLPSMLEYFFPYKGQQALFSSEEIEFLQTKKAFVVNDSNALKIFVNDINKATPCNLIVCERSVASLSCYRDNIFLTSFPIYNDDSVVINNRDRFIYPNSSPGLRKLMPMIQSFDLRVNCSTNLVNLWHRLRLNYKGEKKSIFSRVISSGKTKKSYPAPINWCDALVRTCRTIKMQDQEIIKPFICPGTGEVGKYPDNKSNYAMNPYCKYDSPPDMVLLLETEAGWNQHGGPELFTFDNHDPKGGCVLLNDGTVKFIRTPEELRQLRWK
jgi:hypothetical protein